MSPPSALRMSGFSAPSAGAKAGSPSFQSDTWRCIELPESLLNGFAMNVALTPSRRATSRTPYFSRMRGVGGRERVVVREVDLELAGAVLDVAALEVARSRRARAGSPRSAGSRSFAFCSE